MSDHPVVGNPIRHPCSNCGIETNHIIVAFEVTASSDPDYRYEERFMLVRCLGCGGISFRKEAHDFEAYYQVGENEWEYDIGTEVFPPFLAGHKSLTGTQFMPPIVRSIYEQTLYAIKLGHYVLAGIGLRATVEAICREHQVEGRNLSTQISRLAAAGLISRKDARNLQGIRFMGNDAAHDLQSPKKEAIRIALRIVEHVLETQYTLTPQAEAYLDLPIENLDEFRELIESRLWTVEEGAVFSIRSLLARDMRRITEYARLETEFEVEIQNGQFGLLERVQIQDERSRGINLYKRVPAGNAGSA
jgi:hypothetical protein